MSSHGNRRLTDKEVREIKKRLDAGETYKNIARDYSVTGWTIGNIYRGGAYRDITDYPDRDSQRDRRVVAVSRTHQARGSEHACAKLSEAEVRLIKHTLLGAFTQRGMAKAYGVSSGAINAIVAETTWAHVKIVDESKKLQRRDK